MAASPATTNRVRSATWPCRCLLAIALAPGAVLAGASGPLCDVILEVEGVGVGSIPDGAVGGNACGDPGAPRDVSFAIAVTPGLSLVNVGISVALTHNWVADVTATLYAPDGTPHTLFGRLGATVATACGDSSDLAGAYFFNDFVTQPAGGIWQAATDANSVSPVAPGSYRTTDSGGTGATNPMPPTSMVSSFAGVDPSGTWILRLTDGGEGDQGTVSAATLSLCLSVLGDEVFADGFEGPIF